MGAEFIHLQNYTELKAKLDELSKAVEKLIYLYFVGEKNEKGISWCSDCEEAEPIFKKAADQWADPNCLILVTNVGNRETWLNRENPFRKDKSLHLLTIPTLIRWNGVERLEENYVKKPDLLQMFFEDTKSTDNV